MAPLQSTERRLIDLALASVRHGLDGDGPMDVDTGSLPAELREHQGVFVTLLVDGELNGCVGTLFPTEPLAAAVARLAWDSAFADPRLPRLRWSDYDRLSVKISLLSPLQPLPPLTFDQLVASLQPGVDGLLIRIEGRQATFLPAVWDKLPNARAFVQQLQFKAGIAVGYWPSNAEAFTYTAREFGDSTSSARSAGGAGSADVHPGR
jgi:AmmeMemoRadiSam system protein A